MKSQQIQVQYFAVFREAAGCSAETLDTDAETVAALYQVLRARYGFHLTTALVKAAVNGEFAPWEQPLQSGDSVVFIPPVAGG